jgi:hypothetical protein
MNGKRHAGTWALASVVLAIEVFAMTASQAPAAAGTTVSLVKDATPGLAARCGGQAA